MVKMKIVKHTTFDSIDKGKFAELVQAGFGRPLVNDYFEYVNPDYICLALAEEGSYVGAIVVERIPELHDVYYLDKIVVNPEMQRQGVGKMLWSALNGNSPKLIWRAKGDNPINEFYEKQSEGNIDKRTRWECQRCGNCCRDFIISKNKALSKIQDGKPVCRYLNWQNLCENYLERPFLCKLYPFIADPTTTLKEDGIAKPQNAFKPERLKIHTECPGYGKGKRVHGNKNLQKKISGLGYEFALHFKKCFEEGKDIEAFL